MARAWPRGEGGAHHERVRYVCSTYQRTAAGHGCQWALGGRAWLSVGARRFCHLRCPRGGDAKLGKQDDAGGAIQQKGCWRRNRPEASLGTEESIYRTRSVRARKRTRCGVYESLLRAAHPTRLSIRVPPHTFSATLTPLRHSSRSPPAWARAEYGASNGPAHIVDGVAQEGWDRVEHHGE